MLGKNKLSCLLPVTREGAGQRVALCQRPARVCGTRVGVAGDLPGPPTARKHTGSECNLRT